MTKINVTWEDIDRGIPSNPHFCPVARAITEATGLTPSIDGNFIRIDSHVIILPVEARHFIHRFDRGESVEPFSFEVAL